MSRFGFRSAFLFLSVSLPAPFSLAAQDHGGMRSGSLGEPRSRASSGTAWLPDASSIHALHGRSGAWELMLHGALGYVRQIAPWGGLVPGFGAGVTVSFVPEELESAYGSRTPAGLQIFFRLRPEPVTDHGAAVPDMDHGDH